jgi:hypothetical protein
MGSICCRSQAVIPVPGPTFETELVPVTLSTRFTFPRDLMFAPLDPGGYQPSVAITTPQCMIRTRLQDRHGNDFSVILFREPSNSLSLNVLANHITIPELIVRFVCDITGTPDLPPDWNKQTQDKLIKTLVSLPIEVVGIIYEYAKCTVITSMWYDRISPIRAHGMYHSHSQIPIDTTLTYTIRLEYLLPFDSDLHPPAERI